MPLQTYRCPVHGEFELRLSFKDEIPGEVQCPAGVQVRDFITKVVDVEHCGAGSQHVLKPPAAIIISGGTGAGSGRR